MLETVIDGSSLSLVANKKTPDKVLGQLGSLTEKLLVELVVASYYIGIGLLLCFAKERGSTRQPTNNKKRYQGKVELL